MKKIEVVAAIIINDNKILCMQRRKNKLEYISKKFEFPGGKVEVNESLTEALMRELCEEMNINVKVESDNYFMKVVHTYQDFMITLHAFKVYDKVEKFIMNDHIASVWSELKDLKKLDWAAADYPIIEKLMEEDYENRNNVK